MDPESSSFHSWSRLKRTGSDTKPSQATQVLSPRNQELGFKDSQWVCVELPGEKKLVLAMCVSACVTTAPKVNLGLGHRETERERERVTWSPDIIDPGSLRLAVSKSVFSKDILLSLS